MGIGHGRLYEMFLYQKRKQHNPEEMAFLLKTERNETAKSITYDFPCNSISRLIYGSNLPCFLLLRLLLQQKEFPLSGESTVLGHSTAFSFFIWHILHMQLKLFVTNKAFCPDGKRLIQSISGSGK